jgi:enoyl-[acyl-carrier protein] reductase/trans-2-enoyl-CoA reductase (NAD+)
MPLQTVTPRIRAFICLNAHPAGCAANVQAQVDRLRREAPGTGLGGALVIGSSTGYGLSSLVTSVFGYGARAVGVCLERPPKGERTASAGWYNLAAVHRLARASGHAVETVVGDAYSDEIKRETVARLERQLGGAGKLDLVVYSLASPKRTDPKTGVSYNSELKPIGAPFRSKNITLSDDKVGTIEIAPATADEIESTRKVMGGEDWALWMDALLEAGLLARGARAVAYSYIGPELTTAIYRSGTIGRAKEDLEVTAHALDEKLRARLGGAAYVSVNKAIVTQASAAIPVVPLYISLLYKVMKELGTHEGAGEQIERLFRDHLGPGKTPALDAARRIRIDDLEMDPRVQEKGVGLWHQVTTENLFELTDYAGFKQEFRALFGFEVPGVDYTQPVETDIPIEG